MSLNDQDFAFGGEIEKYEKSSNLVLSVLLAEQRWWVLEYGYDVDEVLPPADLEAGLPLLVLRLLVAPGLQQDLRQLPPAHRGRYVQGGVPVLKQVACDKTEQG